MTQPVIPDVKKTDMDELMRRITEAAGGQPIVGDLADINDLAELFEPQLSPMERAIIKAIEALKEIKVYAEYGAIKGCLTEAVDALAYIEEMRVLDRTEKGLPAEEESISKE